MQITFNIPDDKVDNLRAGILRAFPKPVNSTLSDLQWIKRLMKNALNAMYHQGAKQLYFENNPYNSVDIIEE